MILNLILSFSVIAGVALLYRNYRYDQENSLNKYIDRLPYFLNKPLSCGLCFTFWVALAYNFVFTPLDFWSPEFRYQFSNTTKEVLTFLSSWMILGTGSGFIVYFIDTFFQVSHYFKHKTHKHD